MFRISAVVLKLSAPSAYPILSGRPWLKTARIKQSWQKNIISFWQGKTKVRVSTQEQAGTSKELTPLYAEAINMLDGLADEEVYHYLAKNTKIIPLFEVDICRQSCFSSKIYLPNFFISIVSNSLGRVGEGPSMS